MDGLYVCTPFGGGMVSCAVVLVVLVAPVLVCVITRRDYSS